MKSRTVFAASAVAASLASLLLAGCATPTVGPSAIADLQPTTGNTANGSVQFVQVGDSVRINGTVRGLKPNAEHGFHIHEKGDCSSGDGMSTGGHFNPTGVQHGRFGHPGTHAGELPSLHADATGTAVFSVDARTFTIGTGTADIVGRGLVVHRDPDDYVSQPAGNSGPRIACAVITRR